MTAPHRPAAPRTVQVVSTRRLSRSLVRVVVGGPELAGFDPVHADAYVKIVFTGDDAGPDDRPRLRTYTVRSFDPVSTELALDLVVHGDAGVAGPWALSARPGDRVQLLGPGGAYSPDPDADFHVLVGDESALPAIAVTLERVRAEAPVHAFVEVRGLEDEIPLARPVTWLHRGAGQVGGRLVDTVTSWDVPDGDGHWFVHGEAGFVRQIRAHLRDRLELPTRRLSISGYWRAGVTDEQRRAIEHSGTPRAM